MNSLLRRYKALPRSMQWIVVTVLLLVLYFGVVERVMDLTNAARERADTLAAGLQKERALTSIDSEQGRILENGRRSFGEPYLPGNPENRPEALHSAVDRILDEKKVGNRVKVERVVRMPVEDSTRLLGALAATNTVERLILDISFEASPEVVAEILAELEQAKIVAAVSRVEIRRQDANVGRGVSAAPASTSKIVKATISPEAWVLTPTSQGTSSGGFR